MLSEPKILCLVLQETEFYNKYLHESCPPPIQSSAAPDARLSPVTLDLAQEGETDTGTTQILATSETTHWVSHYIVG